MPSAANLDFLRAGQRICCKPAPRRRIETSSENSFKEHSVMAHVRVDASPDTVHWGFFDAGLAPVAEIDSGGTVTISTVSGTPDLMPRPPLEVPPALAAIH